MGGYSVLPLLAELLLSISTLGLVTLANAQSSMNWAPVVAVNKSATVLLRIETMDKPPGYGSGVLISEEGHLLTARHILPPPDVINSGKMLINGLLGWDTLPLDFNQADIPSVTYVSSYRDLALLSIQPPPKTQPACGFGKVRQGEPLLLMGYPGGGPLTVTGGIASGPAPDGLYKTDAGSGGGESGGPVLNGSGGMVGIHLQGTKRTADGEMILAYFLTAEAIVDDLSKNGLDLKFYCSDKKALTSAPQPVEFNMNYPIDETKDDHPGIIPDQRPYLRSFAAQEGYSIISANFIADSINHVREGPTVQIIEGGRQVDVRFVLESGPIFDRWRGWLSGRVSTRQRVANSPR